MIHRIFSSQFFSLNKLAMNKYKMYEINFVHKFFMISNAFVISFGYESKISMKSCESAYKDESF